MQFNGLHQFDFISSSHSSKMRRNISVRGFYEVESGRSLSSPRTIGSTRLNHGLGSTGRVCSSPTSGDEERPEVSSLADSGQFEVAHR